MSNDQKTIDHLVMEEKRVDVPNSGTQSMLYSDAQRWEKLLKDFYHRAKYNHQGTVAEDIASTVLDLTRNDQTYHDQFRKIVEQGRFRVAAEALYKHVTTSKTDVRTAVTSFIQTYATTPALLAGLTEKKSSFRNEKYVH